MDDFETVRNLHTADPHDLSVPSQERKPVAEFQGNLTINQKFIQLFLAARAQGPKTVARLAASDGEVSARLMRPELENLAAMKLVGQGRNGSRLPDEPNRALQLGNAAWLVDPKRVSVGFVA